MKKVFLTIAISFWGISSFAQNDKEVFFKTILDKDKMYVGFNIDKPLRERIESPQNEVFGVSQIMFEALKKYIGENKYTERPKNMFDYLKANIPAENISELSVFSNSFESRKNKAAAGGGGSGTFCFQVYVNADNYSFSNQPMYQPTNHYAENKYNYVLFVGRPHTHEQFINYEVGPFRDANFDTHGYHAEREFSWNMGDNTPANFSKFSFMLVCLDQFGQPSKDPDCNCNGLMDIKAEYNSKLLTNVNVEGIWNRNAVSVAQDFGGVFVSIDGAVQQLANKSMTVARHVKRTWDGEKLKNAVKIGTEIGINIASNTVSQSDIENATKLFGSYVKKESDNGTSVQNMNLEFNGTIPVKVNSYYELYLASSNTHYGKGYGGEWTANNKINNNYFLAIQVKPSTSRCIFKRTGFWDGYSNSTSPIQNVVTPQKIKGFFTSRGWSVTTFPNTNTLPNIIFEP